MPEKPIEGTPFSSVRHRLLRHTFVLRNLWLVTFPRLALDNYLFTAPSRQALLLLAHTILYRQSLYTGIRRNVRL